MPAVLSLLIPGLGQFVNRDTKKGFVMLGAAIVLGVPTGFGLWFVVAIWSVIDAYQVADGRGKAWT